MLAKAATIQLPIQDSYNQPCRAFVKFGKQNIT